MSEKQGPQLVPRIDTEERVLIQRACEGDSRAFEMLIGPYDRRLLALVRDLVGDAEDARDIYQEAMLAVFRALPGFRMESRFSTWMHRIALNQALRFRRRRRQPRAAAQSLEEQAAARPERFVDRSSTGAAPDAVFLAGEMREQLHRALADLSPQERSAFVLCHLHAVKLQEAAAWMECSTGSVKSYLFRARGKIRRALTSYLRD